VPPSVSSITKKDSMAFFIPIETITVAAAPVLHFLQVLSSILIWQKTEGGAITSKGYAREFPEEQSGLLKFLDDKPTSNGPLNGGFVSLPY
jgi:hypothetical protein